MDKITQIVPLRILLSSFEFNDVFPKGNVSVKTAFKFSNCVWSVLRIVLKKVRLS